jgi:hypothetical protein
VRHPRENSPLVTAQIGSAVTVPFVFRLSQCVLLTETELSLTPWQKKLQNTKAILIIAHLLVVQREPESLVLVMAWFQMFR